MGQLTVARPRAFSPRGPEPRWHWQLQVEATASGAQCQWTPGLRPFLAGVRLPTGRGPSKGRPGLASDRSATDCHGRGLRVGEALSTWQSLAAAPGPVVSYSLALCSEARAQSPTWKLRLQSKSGVSFMRTSCMRQRGGALVLAIGNLTFELRGCLLLCPVPLVRREEGLALLAFIRRELLQEAPAAIDVVMCLEGDHPPLARRSSIYASHTCLGVGCTGTC